MSMMSDNECVFGVLVAGAEEPTRDGAQDPGR